jgi:hypothetical protein
VLIIYWLLFVRGAHCRAIIEVLAIVVAAVRWLRREAAMVVELGDGGGRRQGETGTDMPGGLEVGGANGWNDGRDEVWSMILRRTRGREGWW